MVTFAKSKQEIFVLVGVLGVTFSVFYVNFLVGPQMRRLRAVNPQITSLRTQVGEFQRRLSSVNADQASLLKLNEKVRLLEAGLEAEEDISRILNELYDMAKELDVEIVRTQPVKALYDSADDAQRYKELPVAVEARCSYPGLIEFIKKIESNKRVMKVSQVRVRATETSPTVHQVRFVVSSYFALPGKAEGL